MSTSGMQTVIYPVHDLAASKELFTRLLGVQPTTDEDHYVGYDLAGQHIGLDPHGHARGLTEPTSYWHVDDIRGTMTALIERGAVEQQAVVDVGGGKLLGSVSDADGNVIGLIQSP
jgi:catechol 2,3-dioxygenase-like lactoylglutathione lyase family enzyme